MKRIVVLAVILFGSAFAFEAYSGRDLGVRRMVQVTVGAISGGFAGGYGMATGASQSIGGSVGGLSKGVSNNVGAVFGN